MDIYLETKRIMGAGGFSKLTKNQDAIEECHSAKLMAEAKYNPNDPSGAKIGTLKFRYVLNACRNYIRKVCGPKYKLHRNMLAIGRQKENKSNFAHIEALSYQPNSRNDFDGERLVAFVKSFTFTLSHHKEILLKKYIEGKSDKELSVEYKMTESGIRGILRKTTQILRENISKSFIMD